jgi:hypothetical protein
MGKRGRPRKPAMTTLSLFVPNEARARELEKKFPRGGRIAVSLRRHACVYWTAYYKGPCRAVYIGDDVKARELELAWALLDRLDAAASAKKGRAQKAATRTHPPQASSGSQGDKGLPC